jgi:hypothetical protein
MPSESNEKLCGCDLAILYVSTHKTLPGFDTILGYSEEVWNWAEKTFNPNRYTKEKKFCCVETKFSHLGFVVIKK